MLRRLVIAGLVIGALALAGSTLPSVPPAAAIPVDQLHAEAARGAVPYLTTPPPYWLPLPASGRVSVAAAYPPQPPYGTAISITLEVRRVVPPFDFTFATDLALDARALLRPLHFLRAPAHCAQPVHPDHILGAPGAAPMSCARYLSGRGHPSGSIRSGSKMCAGNRHRRTCRAGAQVYSRRTGLTTQ